MVRFTSTEVSEERQDGAGSTSDQQIDPVDLARACEEALPHSKAGQFYGPIGDMAFGTGVIVTDLPYPVFLPNAGAYGTRRGTALIMSHECDIDPDNVRPFNDNALVAPVIGLRTYVENVAHLYSADETRSFILAVAKGLTTRLLFLPRFGDSSCPLYYGGLIDLNFMTSCGVKALSEASKICALSGAAISIVDVALQNHLIRPKADTPPLPH